MITKNYCLEGIGSIILDQQINYERLQLGHPVKRIQKRFYSHRNKKIEQAQKDLITRRISLEQFLKIFTKTEWEKEILSKGAL